MIEPGDSYSSEKRKYRGVRKRSWGKWVSEIRLPNSREKVWLGSYSTAEEAARAYDSALISLRGSASPLNFPEAPPQIASRCLTARCLQATAAAAASFPSDTTRNADQECQCSSDSTHAIHQALSVALPPPTCNDPEIRSRAETNSSLDDQSECVEYRAGAISDVQREKSLDCSHQTVETDNIFERLQPAVDELYSINDLAQVGLFPTSTTVTSLHRFDVDRDSPMEPGLWNFVGQSSFS